MSQHTCNDCGDTIDVPDCSALGGLGPKYCDGCLEERQREEQKRAERQRRRELPGRLERAGVPQKWRLVPSEPPELLRGFARADFPRQKNGIYIPGAKGAGKTYAACACLREWVVSEFVEGGRESTSAMFVSMPHLIAESFQGSDRLLRAARAEFLVIDDVGATSTNAHCDDKIYTLLDAREKSAMPTVMTSNLEPHNLPEHAPSYDARCLRRIREMCDGGQVLDYQPEGGLIDV